MAFPRMFSWNISFSVSSSSWCVCLGHLECKWSVWIPLSGLSATRLWGAQCCWAVAMTLSRELALACSSKLLSHTIVFWAFCKALYYFGRKITMEGYVRAPWECLVPAVRGFALCWRVLRKPPQPRPRRMSSLLQYFLSIHCGWGATT